MTLLSADSFDRADSTTNLGSTDGAGSLDPLTWTQHTATWGISSNLAYTSAGATHCLATVDLGTGDIDISLDVAPSTDPPQSGILFRYSSTSNYLVVRHNTNSVQLAKNEAGVFTSLGSVLESANPVGETWRILAVGSSLNVFRDGVSIITATDSFNSTATKHGLYRPNTTTDGADNWSASVGVLTNIKTMDGLAYSSTKTVNGLAVASVKTINALA